MENKIGIVYMITSPSKRIYIGSTVNFKNRMCYYKSTLGKSQIRLYNSFIKYGLDNHKFDIIWTGSIEEMLEQEHKIGLKFNVLSKDNLNCKLPKCGDTYHVVRKETRDKMSKWQIGRKMSDESKKKMSKAKIGIKWTKESIKKRTNSQKIPIIQMDLNGEFIKEWKSATDAAIELNIKGGHISTCCRKERKSCNGFQWKWKYEKKQKNKNNL
jgi:group I intron endonuclease